MVQIRSGDGVGEHLNVIPRVHTLDRGDLRSGKSLPVEADGSEEGREGVADEVKEINGVRRNEDGLGTIGIREGNDRSREDVFPIKVAEGFPY